MTSLKAWSELVEPNSQRQMPFLRWLCQLSNKDFAFLWGFLKSKHWTQQTEWLFDQNVESYTLACLSQGSRSLLHLEALTNKWYQTCLPPHIGNKGPSFEPVVLGITKSVSLFDSSNLWLLPDSVALFPGADVQQPYSEDHSLLDRKELQESMFQL